MHYNKLKVKKGEIWGTGSAVWGEMEKIQVRFDVFYMDFTLTTFE